MAIGDHIALRDLVPLSMQLCFFPDQLNNGSVRVVEKMGQISVHAGILFGQYKGEFGGLETGKQLSK
jgi:hypothetical protein